MKKIITALLMLSIIGCSKSDLKQNLVAANVQFISYTDNDLNAYVSAKSSTRNAEVKYDIKINYLDGTTETLPTDGYINIENYFAIKVYNIAVTKNIVSIELVNIRSNYKIVNWNIL
jgi:hypothetical protein